MVAALLLTFALLQSALPTQTSSPQMGTPKALTDDKAEKCIIEGKVVSAVDGQPLKKTVVTLMSQQPQGGAMIRPLMTLTDGDGKFVFKDVDASRYSMNFFHNGFARTNYGARLPNGPGTTLSLIAGQHLKDINARLIPAAAINGRILDDDNDPVANAYVQLQRWGFINGKRQLMPNNVANTDDRGQFRIFGIAPGRYYLSVTYEQNGTMYFNATDANQKEVEETYAPTYFPGVVDIGQASALDLKAGEDMTGLALRLTRAKTVRVSGVVRGLDGPVRNAMVQLLPRGTSFFGRLTARSTDEKGAFSFTGIMPGSYVVSARGGVDQQQLAGRAEVDVAGSPLENVFIDMTAGADVEADVRVDGAVDLSKVVPRLMLATQEISFTPFSSAQIKDVGSVTLTKVYDGNYLVRVGPLPDDAFVSKAVYDEKDALAEGVKIRGGAASKLELTISAAGAHVEGTVQDKDHQAVAGAVVALVPEESKRSRQDLFRNATSDQYGHFVLRGIPPGTYKLFAWESIDSGAYMDPEFLKSYEDQAKTVELGPGERSSPELRVIPSAKTGM